MTSPFARSELSAQSQPQRHILCMKWGTKYGPEYVNRIYAMVARNLTPPFQVICFTDDRRGTKQMLDNFTQRLLLITILGAIFQAINQRHIGKLGAGFENKITKETLV